MVETGEIAQNEQFHLFPQCFLCHLYLFKYPGVKTQGPGSNENPVKSFNSHTYVVVCSFFEFWKVSKWRIREWVKPFPKQNRPLRCLQYNSFENSEGKLLITSNSPFPAAFSTHLENFQPFNQIQGCRLQTLSASKSLKFVVWERVNIFK